MAKNTAITTTEKSTEKSTGEKPTVNVPSWNNPCIKNGRGKTAQIVSLDIQQKERINKTFNTLKECMQYNKDIKVSISIDSIDGHNFISGVLRAKVQVSKKGQAMIVLSDPSDMIKRTDDESGKYNMYGTAFFGTNIIVSEPTEKTQKNEKKEDSGNWL